MTNKSSLIERIAKLARDEQLEGLTDLRDESDRQGMRIVIELTKNANPDQVLQELYNRTAMRTTFGIIMLALVNGEPRLLSLKQALRVYLEHRFTVVRLRSEFDLAQARERAHILEGIRVALQNLDEVIGLIRQARTVESARTRLRQRFKLSVEQAQAILEMPLRRLAALERKKIETEYKTLQTTIKRLQSLLSSEKKIRQVVSEELETVKVAYGDARRTQIVRLGKGETRAAVLTASDLTPDEKVWISISPDGMVSRTVDNKPPRLSGSAAPAWLVKANTRDTLYLVNTQGEAAALAVHVLPEMGGPDGSAHFSRISPLTDREALAAVYSLPPKDQLASDWHVITVSRGGMMKRSPLEELPGPAARTFTLVKINEGDQLGWLRLSDGSGDVMLASSDGMAIRFSEEEVRPMGLVATGVMAIKLKDGEGVIGFDLVPTQGEVFLQRSDGHAKRVALDQFPRQGRYGQGVIAWKDTPGTQLVGLTIGKGTQRVILHLQELTAKAIRLDSAPLRTRPSQGASVVSLKPGNRVVFITSPWEPPRPLDGNQKSRSKRKSKKR